MHAHAKSQVLLLKVSYVGFRRKTCKIVIECVPPRGAQLGIIMAKAPNYRRFRARFPADQCQLYTNSGEVHGVCWVRGPRMLGA